MDQESSGPDDMRDEYDFPPGRGVRGKYYERYRRSAAPAVTAAESPFVAVASTAAQQRTVSITMPVSYPVHFPSPKLQVAFETVHAG